MHRSSPFPVLFAGSLAIAACAGDPPSSSTQDPSPVAPPRGSAGVTFYDAYLDGAPPSLVTPVATSSPSGLTIASRDPVRGAVRFAWAKPQPAPRAARALSKRASSPAAAAALWHVERHAADLGVSGAALASLEVTQVHDLGRGAIVVQLGQKVDGLEVWRSGLRVVMNRDLGMVAVSGQVAPAPKGKAAPAFALDAVGAVERAVRDVRGATRSGARPVLAGAKNGYDLVRDADLAEPAFTKRVLFALPDRVVPAYLSSIRMDDGGTVRGVIHVIAADDGRVLYRANDSFDDAFTYRVWADPTAPFRPADGPQANYTPHPNGVPDTTQPGFVAPVDITMEGFNHPAGGGAADPWLPDGATTTVGNNIDAYADLGGANGFDGGDLRATTTAPGQFLRTYDVTQDPQANATQEMAAVTQLFYVNNWLHDWWYDSGFDEAAGNAQTSNLGRGGVEGDAILAEAQDFSGTDNANMATGVDGQPPRMQMYVFSAPDGEPRGDGTIDNLIIAHEWGHYWHHRLVNCGSTSCGAMSEGFGDFVALMTALREGDNLDGTYGMSTYVTRAFYDTAGYYGIRRYPYSTDFTKNALTFKYIANGAGLPAGVPVNDFFAGNPNFEVHNAGEVWAAMLFEGLVDMLELSEGASPKYTFEEARRAYADYVVAGMKAAPVEPTFVELRDAILAAAAASDTDDFVLLAHSFARRGFGSGAISPPTTTSNGTPVTENFDVTGVLGFESVAIAEGTGDESCDDDGILDVGEVATVTVTLVNTGAESLASPTLTVSSTDAGVIFPDGPTASFTGPVAPFATATAVVKVSLEETATQSGSVTLRVRLSDAGAALTQIETNVEVTVNLDVTPQASATDDAESPFPVWSLDGEWVREDSAAAGSHTFHGVGAASVADYSLTSPPLTVAGAFSLSFRNRYELELSQATNWDGAVLEVSTDDGATWVDASTMAATDYDGVITDISSNPLGGRNGWVGTSTSYPNFITRTIDFGNALAGETVRLRFRIGTDEAVGSFGFEVDDVAVTGAGLPFPETSVEDGECLVGERPTAVAGPDLEVHGGDNVSLDGTGSSDPENTALTYEWSQVSGITVPLQNTTAATATFVAPEVTAARTTRFRLIVRDADGRVSLPDEVTVIILPDDVLPPDASVPDAAVPDAAPADPDADVQDPDASGQEPDAGENPGDGDGGGCGCQTGGGSPAGGGLLAAAIGLALVRRRRPRVS